MKLYNTIIVFDIYVAAENEEDAIAAAHAAIHDEPPNRLEQSEQVANEAINAKSIRTRWIDQKPFVGAAVSDEDFEKLRGKTTEEVHKMLYKKEPKPK